MSIWSKPTVKRKTKIVCTIGPSTDTREMIWKLAEAGMNVARMNMSHGDRSPDGRRFARRCGSPSYVARSSRNFLNVESERMDQPRCANPDLRSPSNRIVPRNSRTLDIVDTREMTDNDEFAGPVHSGRFQDLNADRKSDERIKGGDRCGHFRSFCPPFHTDGGNLHFKSEERPRPVRFCTEDGSDFDERGNLRKRDFERRIDL